MYRTSASLMLTSEYTPVCGKVIVQSSSGPGVATGGTGKPLPVGFRPPFSTQPRRTPESELKAVMSNQPSPPALGGVQR